jgi:hypothetical protein
MFQRHRGKLLLVFEILLIAVWAVWIGREYLNFDPQVIPAGREFISGIQTHHLWAQAGECGWCAFWNASTRGGSPAFVDLHGSMLHPIVMLTTIIWGVINGAKVALVLSFFFGGIAQWWLAREMKLGWLPRMWSALMAVAGGHLAGKMELGAFGVVLSMAMCSLVFSAVVKLARGGGKRAIVILALTVASALMAGQGYIQIGMVVSMLAVPILFIGSRHNIGRQLRPFLIAAGLVALLAAVYLIPLVHFIPNFVKDSDPEYTTAQPIEYLPLNLVIDEHDFYLNESLQKYPYGHLYTMFIGWTAVILAIIGIAWTEKEDRPRNAYLLAVVIIEFLIGSAVLLKLGVKIFPALAGIRHPSQIAGLAVPPILALAAYGLDRLLKHPWPSLSLTYNVGSQAQSRTLSIKWLLLIPLLVNLNKCNDFTKHWIYTTRIEDGVYDLLEELRTPTSQWVSPPFGEHHYIEAAISMGLKLSPGIRTWNWKERPIPLARLEANRAGPPVESTAQIGEADGIPIYILEGVNYAAVTNPEGEQACDASGLGGFIEVVCDSSTPGELVVQENTWSGWRAWRDGERVDLIGDAWLQVDAPAGRHVYEFRYLPWDAPLGLFLTLIGLGLCGWMWFRGSNVAEQPTSE